MHSPEQVGTTQPGDIRRRAARSAALGLCLFVGGLVLGTRLPESIFVRGIAEALAIAGLPLILFGSFRLVFGAVPL